MVRLLIIGAGSFASEVANIAAEIGGIDVEGFVDTRLEQRCDELLDDIPVLCLEDIRSLSSSHQIVVALGTTHRNKVAREVIDLGFQAATLIHPTAHVPDSCQISAGSIIGAGVIIGHKTHIGEHVTLNRGTLIGHHTNIGSFVTISPGANVAARISIGARTYVGMGAIIIDNKTVGSASLIGAGSVVTSDVPDNVQVLGIPARIHKEGIDGY